MKTPLVTFLHTLGFACAIALGLTIFATETKAADFSYPDGQVGVAYDETLNPIENATNYSVTALPSGLSINSSNGRVTGVPTSAGTIEGTLTITFSNNETAQKTYTFTIAAAAGTPEITSELTASGTVGEAFTYTLTASNTPTSFNVDEAALPDGVTRSGATLSGTPSEAGTFNVTVSGNNGSGQGAEVTLAITIAPAGEVPVITSATSISGDANVQLSYQIEATNTATKYSASGLPLGLDIDIDTGFISGTPTIEGTYAVSLSATNEFGASPAFTLTITIGDVPEITNELTLALTKDEAMDAFQLSASNNPTSFTVTGLPAGLSYSTSTKQISGTPTATGTTNVSISASNGVGDGPSSTLVITVSEASVPLPEYRPATFSLGYDNGVATLYLHFDASAADLSVYDYVIEYSENLETWTTLTLDDVLLGAEITDNQDGSKTIKVKYPNPTDAAKPRFIRYKVVQK